MKRRNRRKHTPIPFLSDHIVWFTFTPDTTATHYRSPITWPDFMGLGRWLDKEVQQITWPWAERI